MHRSPLRFTLPLLALVAWGAPAAAQRPEAILSRAAERYRAAETVRALFEQTITNPITGSVLTARGELLHRRPNLLAIDFTAPASDRIVADGDALWVYLPSSAPGQVIRMSARQQARGGLFDPLGQILSAPLQRYTLTADGATKVDGHATHAVTMTPKQESQLFTRATVWVDDSTGVVRQIETVEPSGITRHIVITSFAVDTPLPRAAFRFTPPPRVRVIDDPAR